MIWLRNRLADVVARTCATKVALHAPIPSVGLLQGIGSDERLWHTHPLDARHRDCGIDKWRTTTRDTTHTAHELLRFAVWQRNATSASNLFASCGTQERKDTSPLSTACAPGGCCGGERPELFPMLAQGVVARCPSTRPQVARKFKTDRERRPSLPFERNPCHM